MQMRQACAAELKGLACAVGRLADEVEAEGRLQAAAWAARIERDAFRQGAENLACYLAARRRDLRRLQRRLMLRGLSSLGRMESRVLPTLRAVQASLSALQGQPASFPGAIEMLRGERRLAAARREVFGPLGTPAPALLVTCPSEAAEDPGFMLSLAERGVGAVRINCAHDGPEQWLRMIQHLRAAEARIGRPMRVLMDLAGPKIRTGVVRHNPEDHRLRVGDTLALTRPGALAEAPQGEGRFAVECTLVEALECARPGQRVFVDDGKLCARIEQVQAWGLVAAVTHAEDEGFKLKPEKGLNFPDAALAVPALTAKDRADLEFVAAHADGVEFSFVQSAQDVAELQQALAELRPHDWRELALVLKIETAKAVANLPEMIVAAAGRQPTAVMIARGDLAVEIGFARTAEIQEEILWLGEAAGVPVIWATQVLEHLIKKGAPSRGEMTDAVMAARAECVMLNKGPYLLDAIDELQGLLGRAATNQHKKSPQLRRLNSWSARSWAPQDVREKI